MGFWHVVVYLTICSTVALASALAGVLMFRVLQRMTGSAASAALTVVAVWLGTLCFPYSTLFFSHQLTASLLVGGSVLLFHYRHSLTPNFPASVPVFLPVFCWD